jgi:arylsulfatase A-like enzyme/Tfp pilus assembly protein PilF
MRFRILAAAIAVLAIGAGCRSREEAKVEAAGSPVIIISIDTLRADHLPAYGYDGVATPAIDALRSDSILFSNAYSHVPLTLPSHVSLLTGHLPATTKVRNNLGYRFEPSSLPTIMSALEPNGYESGAAVSAIVLRGTTGLGEAFDFYDDKVAVVGGGAAGSSQRSGDSTVDAALPWIEARKNRPFFFMLHLFEPHTPYEPPPDIAARHGADSYDGEIAAVDRVVGRFIDRLKAAGIYERATIILLSDHGEGLNQHGEEEHGILLYREAIHVPLILKLPSAQKKGTTVSEPAQLIDVMPTVLAITGTKPPENLPGSSLLDIEGKPARRIYAETMYPRIHLGWSDLHSLIDAQHHFIDAPSDELYDIRSDPAERKNILAEQRRTSAHFREEIAKYDRTLNLPGAVDSETAKQLASLGYLGQSGGEVSGPLPDPKDHVNDIRRMREIAQHQTAGNYDRAIEGYRSILARNPRFADAWTQLARTYEEAGMWKEAAEAYRRNLELSPSLAAELGLSLGLAYLNLKDHAAASAHARLALEVNPAGAHLLLGRIALAQKDPRSAYEQAQKAAAFPSYRAPALVVMGQALSAAGRLDEGYAALEQARRESEQSGAAIAGLHYARGDTLARMNRIEEAEAAFLREIEAYPKDRPAYANLTVLYVLQGRKREAAALMEKLVSRNPSAASFETARRTFEEMGETALAARFRRG